MSLSLGSGFASCVSPPQRLPLDFPIKIAIIEKQEARGGERSLCGFLVEFDHLEI